jgi:hypothetical protein
MFWATLIILAPTLYFVKTAIEYVYPDQLRIMAIKIGWNTMEFCSRVEIVATQFYNDYIPTLLAKGTPQASLKFICDGDEIETCTIHNFKKNKNINYDFILYEIPIIKKDNYDKYDNYVVRYEKMADVLPIEYNSMKCFELNMIQMIINESDNPITIDLGRTQYMINGNVLFDRPFLKWYLNMRCHISLEPEDQYVITFIDHEMNYITLPDSSYLLIKKNGYDIVNITL